MLTWSRFILPILDEYSDSGYREPQDKLRYSLRENAQFYAIAIGASVVGLVYVSITYHISLTGMKGTIMALAYCFGLVLAIYLMGHGLVSIPRRLLRDSSLSGRLKRLQIRAPRAYEKMEDTLMTLEEVEAQVTELGRRKTGSALEFRDWIEELQDIANLPETRPRTTIPVAETRDRIVPTVITEKYLADLTRKLIRARYARSRYISEWDDLVQAAARTQTILDSAGSKSLVFGAESPHARLWDKANLLSAYQRYIFYFHIVPYMQIGLGFFLAIASACIVWSEVVKFPFPKLSVIRLSVIHHWVGDKAEVGFAGQVISAFWICYMCAAALVSMTEVKVWRGRGLVRRNTSYESAFWYATQVAKLSVPLAYNFMTFLSSTVYEKTTFYSFLGKLINLTSLGRWFDDLFPLFLLFPVCATLFGLYGKAKRLFVGADLIDDEDNMTGYGSGSWREGRDLIERELGGETSRRRDELFSRLESAQRRPVLSVPPSQGGPASLHQAGQGNMQRPGQSSRLNLEENPEDDNIVQIIGHRMKNTFDLMETPKWLQDIGQGITKPKWMGNNNQDGGPSRNDGDIRRWFGGDGQGSGQTGNGQIRL